MIERDTLQTPEDGLTLTNREGEAKAARKTPAAVVALRGRIGAARTVRPTGSDLHCGRCFSNGARAAADFVDAAVKTRPNMAAARSAIVDAYHLKPARTTTDHSCCGRCFHAGLAAALRTIEAE